MTSACYHPAWLDWPETQTLIQAFDGEPHATRFVGGAVRDAVLGREAQDVDVATKLPPGEVMEILAAHGIKAVPTGLAHGTVTAVIESKHFEITTLRRDTVCDGRHAEVAFTDDWQEDAKRRDFTMNALYLTPQGELFDYTGGEDDVKAGRVRFIGDPVQRIEEDHLRILRYFRFLAQMGCPEFDITREDVPVYPATMHVPSFEACAALADRIDDLSAERLHKEMFKMLALPDLSDDVFLWMMTAGVETRIFPDTIMTYCEMLVALEREFTLAPDPMRRLCMCLSDNEFMPLPRKYALLCNRWKLSNAESKRLSLFHDYAYALDLEMTSLANVKQLKRKLGETVLTDLVLITWSTYASVGHGKEKPREAFAPMLDIALHWPPPVFPVTGKDLLDAGMASGKALGKKLKELEREWEESDYRLSKEELLTKL